jgi:hypothetical protein
MSEVTEELSEAKLDSQVETDDLAIKEDEE